MAIKESLAYDPEEQFVTYFTVATMVRKARFVLKEAGIPFYHPAVGFEQVLVLLLIVQMLCTVIGAGDKQVSEERNSVDVVADAVISTEFVNDFVDVIIAVVVAKFAAAAPALVFGRVVPVLVVLAGGAVAAFVVVPLAAEAVVNPLL